VKKVKVRSSIGSILVAPFIKMANKSYTYLASNWCTPEISLDDVLQDCYIGSTEAETKGWHSATSWPASALEILGLPWDFLVEEIVPSNTRY
jgi:uncharacterized protein YceK